jgi:hypothetical protein
MPIKISGAFLWFFFFFFSEKVKSTLNLKEPQITKLADKKKKTGEAASLDTGGNVK